ncbi:MAG: hypothetical protein HY858_13020 [Candidatus Solibacter usitatus]|nr:hypothetical protein [Candidatus Solibacter usitatus]
MRWYCLCALLCLLGRGACLGQGPGEESDNIERRAGAPAASGFVRPVVVAAPKRREPWLKPGDPQGVDWGALARQGGFFLNLQHAFRLATEPGTREGLKGPFIKGWLDSASNLNGWADGDPFYVNYVGHPMQGAAAGFIWAQNDRSYRRAEFGKNPVYWKARARAAAFAAAYSMQFEIGPVSEASIGKIQSTPPQQGYVDHVITPVVGAGWMLVEDALDQYVIKRIERAVSNPVVRLMARGWLNPSRSFANMMRLQAPWTRDNRPGVYSPLLSSYLEDERGGRISGPRQPPVERQGQFGIAPLELAAEIRPQTFFGEGAGALTCIGGGGEAAYRVTDTVQMVVDVYGCKMLDLKKNLSGDTMSYLLGPRWTPRPASRWSPYAHLLVGGMKVSEERMYPALKAVLMAEATRLGKKMPLQEEYTTKYQNQGVSLAAGSGVDLRLNPAVALRLASLEYKRSWLPPVNGREFEYGLAFKTSVVLRMGTW